MTNEELNTKKRLIGQLLDAGARSLKLNSAQEMKIREWIIPYSAEEFGYSTEPLKMEQIRKFIDAWENSELSEENYKYYYVKKNSDGKSLWDLI